MDQLTLSHAAQTLMDMYYRDFKAEGEFFDYEHFEYVARSAWGKILDDEAKIWRKIARQETGYYTIDVNSEWLIDEVVEVKKHPHSKFKYTAEMKDTPFAFMFDKWSWAVQRVSSEHTDEFERITVDSQWKMKHLPVNKRVWWYPQANTINFFSSCEDIKNITVTYLPSGIGDKVVLPISKLLDIAQLGYQIMIQVKSGIVDKTANLNPNVAPQTEIDNVLSSIRTKQQG